MITMIGFFTEFIFVAACVLCTLLGVIMTIAVQNDKNIAPLVIMMISITLCGALAIGRERECINTFFAACINRGVIVTSVVDNGAVYLTPISKSDVVAEAKKEILAELPVQK